MALWQFLVFALLIGTLLAYVSVLTRRVGCTNARLKRIEETLLVLERLLRHADTRAGESRPSPEVFSGDRRAAYLTLRDLKAGSELLSSRPSRSRNEKTIATTPVSRHAPKTHSEPVSSAGARHMSGDSAATSSETRQELKRTTEPRSSPSTRPALGNSVAAGSQSRAPAETSSEPSGSPTTRPANDSAAKRDRDALFIMMSSQRRRRRAREGY